MTADEFRRIALQMSGATEGAHMGHPDFRANGRIFATLHPGNEIGMVKLTQEQQKDFLESDAKAFSAASGAWGRQGCTNVRLDSVNEDQLGEAMTLAWQGTVKATKPKAKRNPKTR